MSFSSSSISQKEYLKKYLSGDEKKKKKKKIISGSNIKRSRIIDDDIDLKSLRPLDDDEVELYQMDEDAPQIAGIIDERPPEIKAKEYYSSKRWKVFGGDDGVNVVDNMDIRPQNNQSEFTTSTNREPSENLNQKPNFKKKNEDRSDYDLVKIKSSEVASRKQKTKSSDDDFSPPRKENSKKNSFNYSSMSKYSDSDQSPPRQKKSPSSELDSDMSPLRKSKLNLNKDQNDLDSQLRKHQSKKYDKYSDSDKTYQRKESKNKSEKYYSRSHENERSRNRKKNRSHSPSHTITIKDSSDSDKSLPRKEKSYYKQDKYSDSDASPPRKRDNYYSNKLNKKNYKDERGSSKKCPDDLKRRSPKQYGKETNAKKSFSDSDNSPPRKRSKSHQGNKNDSDLSPPRKNYSARDDKHVKKPFYKPDSDSSSEERSKSKNNKMKKTLDGKQAGLQDAKQLKKELSDLRMKEDAMFSKMDASVSGVGAAPVKRDRKTGQVRDIEKEVEAQKEKEAKESIVNEKYYKWGRGIKQTEDAAVKAAEIMKEMNKPLARYVDDEDLDDFLKKQEREGDPMLDYIRRKQSEATPLEGEKPIYKGSWNPNRFNIRPGYRWDGVVRSNGYEKEWFKVQNAKKARDEEAYKWSTSDM